MSDGLRLMIFDNTDVRGWTKQIKDAAPDPVDNVIDGLGIEVGLTHSWLAGGWLYRQFGRFDHTQGFASWVTALQWLCSIEPERQIDEIQFWGHGSPGGAWMHGEVLTKNAFTDSIYGPLLQRLKTRITDDSLIWFRSCSIFCGQVGHEFATSWVKNLGCRIAAHTHIVHAFQSGLYCVDPGRKPWWSKKEGIKEGTVDRPTAIKWGLPWTPRTILALQSNLPNWASDEDY